MPNLSIVPNMMNVGSARRSTRVPESVRLSVSGQSNLGTTFSESTLTLAVNCHGCVYPAHNEHQTGSWVTLDLPTKQNGLKTQSVRALVKFVRAPRGPREPFQVGVELETPANVWQVPSVPEDWRQFPVLIGDGGNNVRAAKPVNAPQPVAPLPISAATSELVQQAPAVAPEATGLNWMISAPDQLVNALEKNLHQAAEKAVASAVASRLNAAVNQAITAIEKFSEASVRQIEERTTLHQKKLMSAASDELFRRFQADLAQAEGQIQKQIEHSLTEVQEKTQGVAKNATMEAHLIMAQSVDFLKETARDFHGQFATQLRETMDRSAAELSAETVRFSDRQMGLLAKQAQASIAESARLLENKTSEARGQLEAVGSTMLNDFHQKASMEIDQAAKNVRQNFTASLNARAAEVRAEWDAQQRAWQQEIARASEQQSDQFRKKLESILHSSMVTAISSVNEHSKSLLSSLSAAEEQLKKAAH